MEKYLLGLLIVVGFASNVWLCNAEAFWYRSTNIETVYDCLKKQACNCDGPDLINQCFVLMTNATVDYVNKASTANGCSTGGLACQDSLDCFHKLLASEYEFVLKNPDAATFTGYLDHFTCLNPVLERCEQYGDPCKTSQD